MIPRIIRYGAISALCALITGTFPAALAMDVDHSAFERILRQYVNGDGLVDYRGIERSAGFKAYLADLEASDVGNLSGTGRLAFWINAYNAITIDKVIKWKPEKSVRETFLPGVWTGTRFFKTREHVIAGKRLSQDDIEHRILRKAFPDPRIHFALICASKGCPSLPRFAYTAENVMSALDSVTREYIASAKGIRFDPAGEKLHVSKIFKWYRDDFIAHSGSIAGFLAPYLDGSAAAQLKRGIGIAYLPYDWSLNAQEPLR